MAEKRARSAPAKTPAAKRPATKQKRGIVTTLNDLASRDACHRLLSLSYDDLLSLLGTCEYPAFSVEQARDVARDFLTHPDPHYPGVCFRPMNYAYAEGKQNGRQFARAYGLQTCTRLLRSLLSNGVTIDIDIENAHPVILEWLCRIQNIPTPTLRQYVLHRADILANTPPKTKKAVCISMYSDKYVSIGTGDFFIDLDREFKSIQRAIVPGAVFNSGDNPLASELSLLISNFENQVLMHMVACAQQLGWGVSTLCFDGFLVREHRDKDTPGLLRHLEYCVSEKFPGLNIRLKVKPFDILPATLSPPPTDGNHNIDPHAFLAVPEPVRWSPDVKVEDLDPDSNGYIHPFVYNMPDSRPVQCVKAFMGAGKTHQINHMVEKMEQSARLDSIHTHTKRPLRVLAISCRVAFSHSQMSAYKGFHHYSDKNFYRYNRIVVQYESLHLLFSHGALRWFDLIIVDELRALLACTTSLKTNRQFVRKNFELFISLLQVSRRVIVCDADLECDDACRSFLESAVLHNNISVHRYSHVKLPRTVTMTSNEENWFAKLRKRVDAGERVGVVCRTRKTALAVARALYPDGYPDTCKVYTRDSSDEVMRDFRDINAALVDATVVVMTSKVTVGADILIPWGSIFIHGGWGGCSARDTLQMTGRWRNVVDHEMHTYVQEYKLEKSSPEDRFLEELATLTNAR